MLNASHKIIIQLQIRPEIASFSDIILNISIKKNSSYNLPFLLRDDYLYKYNPNDNFCHTKTHKITRYDRKKYEG